MGGTVRGSRPQILREMPTAAGAAAVLAGALALTGLAGCGAGAEGRSAPKASESGPRAAVTVQQAEALVNHYEKVNNQSNKTLDSKLLSKVEGDTLLVRSRAQQEQVPAGSAKYQKTYDEPFFYTDRRFYIPMNATWFAVEATPEGEGFKRNARNLIIFDRGADGAWKNVASVPVDRNEFPKVSLDGNGYATAAAADHKTGALAPNDLDDAVNDLVVTGGKGKSKQALASTSAAQTVRKIYTDRNENLSARVEFTAIHPEHTTVYALKTEQGVLAIFNGAYDRQEFSTTHYLKPSKKTAIYTGSEQRKHFTLHFLYQGLAHIPATGKASLIGWAPQLIGAET